jgi:SAM-dependent methyltransferase
MKSMKTETSAEIYQKHLIEERSDYEHARQLYLKRRVFRTYDRLMRLFSRQALSGRVLDAGSVRGEFVEVCRENGLEADAVGIETGINFEQDSFPFLSESFDVVCANSVIEHLHDPTMFFKEIHRVLKKDGHVILVTPNWPYAAREFYDTYTHVQPYSVNSLRTALKCNGFRVQATVPWLVDKGDLLWKIPEPYSFLLAALLPFSGLNTSRWVPKVLKGNSKTLLALARKKPHSGSDSSGRTEG